MAAINDLITLEDAADTGNFSPTALSSWPELREMLQAFHAQRWIEVEQHTQKLWKNAGTLHEKAFLIQWGAAAAEMRYDLPCRERWVSAWHQLCGWANHWYARYLKVYQEAMACYFDGRLREAEAGFQTALILTKSNQYLRGQMRSLFHLGLVHRNREEFAKAKKYFSLALQIAEKRQSTQYADRIRAQLDLATSKGFRFDVEKRKIETLILSRQFKQARPLLIQAEIQRRKQKLHRHRECLIYLLALISMGRRKHAQSSRQFRLIPCPLMKIKAYGIQNKLQPLNPEEAAEYDALKEIHGVDRVVIHSTDSHPLETEICGQKLGSLRDQDVIKLMSLLIQATESTNKETLCKEIWNIQYDPILHDSRIYKLIHKTRLVFGKKDLFVNTYGGYQINPAYFYRPILSQSAS